MYEIEMVSIVISLVCLVFVFKDDVPSRDQIRRFLKLMITGKYEKPSVAKKS